MPTHRAFKQQKKERFTQVCVGTARGMRESDGQKRAGVPSSSDGPSFSENDANKTLGE